MILSGPPLLFELHNSGRELGKTVKGILNGEGDISVPQLATLPTKLAQVTGFSMYMLPEGWIHMAKKALLKLLEQRSTEEGNPHHMKQAGAELGQAQLKLGFDITLTFCKFGFSRSSEKIGINHPIVPPLDHFQSFAQTISALRR